MAVGRNCFTAGYGIYGSISGISDRNISDNRFRRIRVYSGTGRGDGYGYCPGYSDLSKRKEFCSGIQPAYRKIKILSTDGNIWYNFSQKNRFPDKEWKGKKYGRFFDFGHFTASCGIGSKIYHKSKEKWNKVYWLSVQRTVRCKSWLFLWWKLRVQS